MSKFPVVLGVLSYHTKYTLLPDVAMGFVYRYRSGNARAIELAESLFKIKTPFCFLYRNSTDVYIVHKTLIYW